jgi:hypothetical protein
VLGTAGTRWNTLTIESAAAESRFAGLIEGGAKRMTIGRPSTSSDIRRGARPR